MTAVSIRDHTDRFLRPLGADLVFKLPIVGDLARKGGATLACNEDAQRMLSGGELVGVWPEGFKGIGKPYSERYKLQRFGRGGFVASAIRTGVPIVPCSVVGAEEIYPLVGNIPSLARLVGLPYLPIMVMEHERLVEKHAGRAGLPGLKPEWTTLGGTGDQISVSSGLGKGLPPG